jgi:hypothetical protein
MTKEQIIFDGKDAALLLKHIAITSNLADIKFGREHEIQSGFVGRAT